MRLFLYWEVHDRSRTAQDAGLEKQLRAEYVVASIGSDGTVIQPGTVVVLQQPGVTALQVTPQISPESSYWPNNYKMGGHVKTSGVQQMNYNPLKGWSRELQAGERAYISSIKIKNSDIVFGLQTIPQDANVAAYRAHISFQFQKGELLRRLQARGRHHRRSVDDRGSRAGSGHSQRRSSSAVRFPAGCSP